MDHYDTPQDAAMVGFPPQHCRVVGVRIDGDEAYVLLDAGSRNQRYLYGVNCARERAGWREGSSGNGGGWSLTDAAGDLGTWSLWDEAPAGADAVRVEYDDVASEHPVHEGIYLVVWFRRPLDPAPRVTGFRIAGRWQP